MKPLSLGNINFNALIKGTKGLLNSRVFYSTGSMFRSNRMAQRFVILLLGGAIVLVVLPSTSAQVCQEPYPAQATLEFEGFTTENFTDPLPPYEVVMLRGNYQYEAPMTAWSQEPLVVEFQAGSNEEWVQISPEGAQNTVHPWLLPVEDYNESLSSEHSFMVTSDAPHGADGVVEMASRADAGDCVYSVPESVEPFEFTVGFHEDWSARFNPSLHFPEVGDAVEFDLEVTSDSNGPIVLSVDLVDAELGTVTTLPPDFRVPAGGDAEASFVYRLESHGYDELIFEVTGHPERDPSLDLEPKTLAVMVGPEGNGKRLHELRLGEAPDLPMAVSSFVLAICALALVRRR